ncbi:hypothetical protein, partial [Stackebrandtia soli]|uniref:hypothetical protein n=1 Tax=Stackebrandtia soli TaxID=1892856 RepID=UPI0039ED4626
PPTPHVSVTEPVDAAGWLDRGRSLAAVDDHRAALDALTTAMRLSTDPAERAVIGTGKIRLLVNGGRLTEATTAHDEYVGNLVASGQTVLADAEREHGLLLHGHTQPTDHDRLRRLATDHDDAEVSTRALLAASRAIGEDDPVASDELCRAAHALAESSGLDSLALEAMHGLLISAIRVPRAPEDVLAVAERLLAVETNPGRRIRVLEMQTMTLGTQHELDAALVAADEALALAVGIGSHTGTAHLARLTARVATELGRAEDAVSRWQLALREATLADENTYVERIELAQQLLLVDRAHEAVELLRDLVSELEDKDDGAETLEQLAHCLFALGIAFRRCGEDSEAYNAFLESVQIAHEADALVIAARSGEKLGALLLEHDDDEAVDVLDTALEDARSQDATAIIVDTLHTRGRARCRFGDAAGLSDLDEALGLAAESAPRWMHADITDSIARGLFHLDRVDEAISTALRAADAFVDLRNDVGAGMALLFAGEVLADGQRYDEAVVILADAIPRLVSVQQFHARACLLAGDAYEHLGRHAEAKDVRAEIDG